VSTVWVRVRVGAEHYGLPVDRVLEVVELGDVVAVPGAPPSVLGVRNVHGHIVPVVDPARLLGTERRDRPARLVIAEDGGRRAGLAVDEIVEVGEQPRLAEPVESDHLVGAAIVGSGLVGLMDVASLLDAVSNGGAP
jgi:purine-binding chemotaxis protein CheW